MDQINEWFDSFYKETIEDKKLIRGRAFSGGRIEIWSRRCIVIVLHHPYLRGKTLEDKSLDLVKNIFDKGQEDVRAEISCERFEKVISGEEPLTDKDWRWSDE